MGHRRVIDAIEVGDYARAKSALREHLRRSRSNMVAALDAPSPR
jgi:DNA-binding GntR family transcriptional regulator